MLYNYSGGCGCNTGCGCGCGGSGGASTCGCSCPQPCCPQQPCGCGGLGSGLGNAAFSFVGDWVNIVVTLTVLQSILGLVCNWNCCGNNNNC